MYRTQRRAQQAYSAGILRTLTCSLVLLLAIGSVSIADPVSVLTSTRSDVYFNPIGPKSAPGGGLDVPTLPTPPQNVTSALTFNFTPVGNLLAMQSGTPAQQATANSVINGFVAAGDIWRSYFADPITVTIEIDYGPLGNGVLGGNSSYDTVQSYSTVRNALALDATSANDAQAVASLQPGSSMKFLTNNTASNTAPTASARIRDNDTSGAAASNNNFLDISRANAKALGIALPAGPDSNITFTDFSDFASPFPVPPSIGWDFDRSDGIASNSIDFIGVATHEIGHAMGFESGVDTVDYVASPNGPGRLAANGGPYDLNQYAVYTTLDLFRFSANSLSQPSQPAGGLRDLAMGQFDANSRPYFSTNSGVTNQGEFATGGFNGDGSQASHWRDNFGIGIMDPTFGTGELGVVSLADRRALDAIGWNPNLVPEPCGFILIFTAIVGLLGCRPTTKLQRAS
jgi:hypothetical protein